MAVEIEVKVPLPIEIDVTNKFVNVGSLSANNINSVYGYVPADKEEVQEQWDNFVQLSNVTLGDTLIHDGSTFTNRPKQELSDGGNF